MNDIATFQFPLSKVHSTTVRTVMISCEPWFVATDVCQVLGFSRTDNMLRMVGPDERSNSPHPVRGVDGRFRIQAVVSESGLYKLILRSNKPSAQRFQDWVTQEVLPALRKDGMYVVGEEKVRSGEMTEDELVLKALELLKAKTERLKEELDNAKPKVALHDRWLDTSGTLTTGDLARNIGFRSAQAFNRALTEAGIIARRRDRLGNTIGWSIRAQHAGKGWHQTKVTIINGAQRAVLRWTPAGVAALTEQFART